MLAACARRAALALIFAGSLAVCAAAQGTTTPPPATPPQSVGNPPPATAAQANPAPAEGDTGTPDIYGGRLEAFVGGGMLFARATTANTVPVTSTNVPGINAGVRFHITDYVAVDARYGYSQWLQVYGQVFREHSLNNEFSGDLALTLPTGFFFKPYVLGGMGIIRFNPTGASDNTPGASGQTKNAIVYGGGVDMPLWRSFTIRAEYRGLFYRVPDFHTVTIANWNHLAEPSVMLVYHFY